MIDRVQRRFDRFDRPHGGSWRAGDHDDLDTEQPGSLDLCIRGRPAAVLRDDGIDAIFPHKTDLALEREGAAIDDIVDIGKGERWIDGIDTAHQIEMLGSDFGMMGALPAGRQKDAARGRTECRNRRRNIRDDMPVITCYRHPFATNERERADTRAFSGNHSISGDPFGEGMGGIDQQVIASLRQEAGKAFRTAEAADADGNRLFGGSLRAPRQRQQDVEVFSRGKFCGEPARLAGAAEDQNTGLVHV